MVRSHVRPLMIEINSEFASRFRFCRRIVPEEGVDLNSLDQNWVEKLKRGAGGRGDIILRKPQTQVPKGFVVVEEVKNYQVLKVDKSRNRKAVHVCNKSEAQGFIKGMSVRWINLD